MVLSALITCEGPRESGEVGSLNELNPIPHRKGLDFSPKRTAIRMEGREHFDPVDALNYAVPTHLYGTDTSDIRLLVYDRVPKGLVRSRERADRWEDFSSWPASGAWVGEVLFLANEYRENQLPDCLRQPGVRYYLVGAGSKEPITNIGPGEPGWDEAEDWIKYQMRERLGSVNALYGTDRRLVMRWEGDYRDRGEELCQKISDQRRRLRRVQ